METTSTKESSLKIYNPLQTWVLAILNKTSQGFNLKG